MLPFFVFYMKKGAGKECFYYEREESCMREEWQGFREGRWLEAVDVRDFIQTNYRPYEEGAEFLCGPTERTEALMKKLEHLFDL